MDVRRDVALWTTINDLSVGRDSGFGVAQQIAAHVNRADLMQLHRGPPSLSMRPG